MSHIILIGFKHVGKSVIGAALAKKIDKDFIDLDHEIEKHYEVHTGQKLSCRQIMATHGEDFFRAKEETVLSNLLNRASAVIALGGGTPLTENNQKHIQPHCVILITAPPEHVWRRIIAQELPAYFTKNEEPAIQFNRLWAARTKVYKQLTHNVAHNDASIDEAVTQLINLQLHSPKHLKTLRDSKKNTALPPLKIFDDKKTAASQKMKAITISFPEQNTQSYNIWIGTELFSSLLKYLPKDLSCSSIVIITDHTVKKLYAVSLKKYLDAAGFRSFICSFPAGEYYKTVKTKIALEQKMFRKHCDRNTLILALGGGITGDLAGFIAATYMRGIAYLQIPTSLLAMIDSSVGGKTGINTHAGKNLIGAFWQPKVVIADLSLLKSLSQKHVHNGLFEAVKIFLTCNQIFFNDFKKNIPLLLKRDVKILTRIVKHAVQLKAQIVCQDEQEQNLRMILNFGHTIGHAIEKLSNYKILHGYAIGLGILVEAKIAELLGWLDHDAFEEILFVLKSLGIDLSDLKNFSITKMIQLTQLDKKTKQQQVKYILLNAIGSVHHDNHEYAHAVPNQIVRKALLILQRL